VNPFNVIDMNLLMTLESSMLIQNIRFCVLPHFIIKQFYRQDDSRVLDLQSEVKGDASSGVQLNFFSPAEGTQMFHQVLHYSPWH
jgi:hypothetical protein